VVLKLINFASTEQCTRTVTHTFTGYFQQRMISFVHDPLSFRTQKQRTTQLSSSCKLNVFIMLLSLSAITEHNHPWPNTSTSSCCKYYSQ